MSYWRLLVVCLVVGSTNIQRIDSQNPPEEEKFEEKRPYAKDNGDFAPQTNQRRRPARVEDYYYDSPRRHVRPNYNYDYQDNHHRDYYGQYGRRPLQNRRPFRQDTGLGYPRFRQRPPFARQVDYDQNIYAQQNSPYEQSRIRYRTGDSIQRNILRNRTSFAYSHLSATKGKESVEIRRPAFGQKEAPEFVRGITQGFVRDNILLRNIPPFRRNMMPRFQRRRMQYEDEYPDETAARIQRRRHPVMDYYQDAIPRRRIDDYNYERNARAPFRRQHYDDYPRYMDNIDNSQRRQYAHQSNSRRTPCPQYAHQSDGRRTPLVNRKPTHVSVDDNAIDEQEFQKNLEKQKKLMELYMKDAEDKTRVTIPLSQHNTLSSNQERSNKRTMMDAHDLIAQHFKHIDENIQEMRYGKTVQPSTAQQQQFYKETISEKLSRDNVNDKFTKTHKWFWMSNEAPPNKEPDSAAPQSIDPETTLDSYEQYLEEKFAELPPKFDMKNHFVYKNMKTPEVVSEWTERIRPGTKVDLSKLNIPFVVSKWTNRESSVTQQSQSASTAKVFETHTKRPPVILTLSSTQNPFELNNSENIRRGQKMRDLSRFQEDPNAHLVPQFSNQEELEVTGCYHPTNDTNIDDMVQHMAREHPHDQNRQIDEHYINSEDIMYDDTDKSDKSDSQLDKLLEKQNLMSVGSIREEYHRSDMSGMMRDSGHRGKKKEEKKKKRKDPDSVPWFTSQERAQQRKEFRGEMRRKRSAEKEPTFSFETTKRKREEEITSMHPYYENAQAIEEQLDDYSTLYAVTKKHEHSGERKYWEKFNDFAGARVPKDFRGRERRSADRTKGRNDEGTLRKTTSTAASVQDSSDQLSSAEYRRFKDFINMYTYKTHSPSSKKYTTPLLRTTQTSTLSPSTTIDFFNIFYRAFSKVSPTTSSCDISSYIKDSDLQGDLPGSKDSEIDHSYYDVVNERVRDLKRGGEGKIYHGQTIKRSSRPKGHKDFHDSCLIPDDYLKKHGLTKPSERKNYHNSKQVISIVKEKREKRRKQFLNRYNDPRAAFQEEESDEFWYNKTTKRPPIILTRAKNYIRTTVPRLFQDVDAAFKREDPVIQEVGAASQDIDKAFDRVQQAEQAKRKKNVEVFERDKNIYTYAYYGRPMASTSSKVTLLSHGRRRDEVTLPSNDRRKRAVTYLHRVWEGDKSVVNETLENQEPEDEMSQSIEDSRLDALEAFVAKYSLKMTPDASPYVHLFRNISTPDPKKIIRTFTRNYDPLDQNTTVNNKIFEQMAALRNASQTNKDFKINLMLDEVYAKEKMRKKKEKQEEADKLKKLKRREKMKKNTIKIMLKKPTPFKSIFDFVNNYVPKNITIPSNEYHHLRFKRSVSSGHPTTSTHPFHRKSSIHPLHSHTDASPSIPNSEESLFGSIDPNAHSAFHSDQHNEMVNDYHPEDVHRYHTNPSQPHSEKRDLSEISQHERSKHPSNQEPGFTTNIACNLRSGSFVPPHSHLQHSSLTHSKSIHSSPGLKHSPPLSSSPCSPLVSPTLSSSVPTPLASSEQDLFGSIDPNAVFNPDAISQQFSRSEDRAEMRKVYTILQAEYNITTECPNDGGAGRKHPMTSEERRRNPTDRIADMNEKQRAREYQRAMFNKKFLEMKYGKPTTLDDLVAEEKAFQEMVWRDAKKDYKQHPERFTYFDISESKEKKGGEGEYVAGEGEYAAGEGKNSAAGEYDGEEEDEEI